MDFGPDFPQLLTATAADPAKPGDKCAGARNSRLHPRRRSGGQTPGIKNLLAQYDVLKFAVAASFFVLLAWRRASCRASLL